MKSLMELYATRVVYRIGYEDDEIDDEFDVIKLIDENGTVTWSVESLRYGDILNSSKLGKKLIKYCQNQ